MRWRNHDRRSNHVDTVHECDRQTDGQTDRITITKTVQRRASHGKNWMYSMCKHMAIDRFIDWSIDLIHHLNDCLPLGQKISRRVVNMHLRGKRIPVWMKWELLALESSSLTITMFHRQDLLPGLIIFLLLTVIYVFLYFCVVIHDCKVLASKMQNRTKSRIQRIQKLFAAGLRPRPRWGTYDAPRGP